MGDGNVPKNAEPIPPPVIQVTGLAPNDHDVAPAISTSEAGIVPLVSATTLAASTTPTSPDGASTSHSGPGQQLNSLPAQRPKEVISAQSSMASLHAVPDPPAGFDGGRRRSSVSRFLASIFNPGDRRGSKDSVSDKSMWVGSD